jgi:hypothetical protein
VFGSKDGALASAFRELTACCYGSALGPRVLVTNRGPPSAAAGAPLAGDGGLHWHLAQLRTKALRSLCARRGNVNLVLSLNRATAVGNRRQRLRTVGVSLLIDLLSYSSSCLRCLAFLETVISARSSAERFNCLPTFRSVLPKRRCPLTVLHARRSCVSSAPDLQQRSARTLRLASLLAASGSLRPVAGRSKAVERRPASFLREETSS